MSKASDAEKQEAVRQLLKFVKPGDTIYTTLEHVSRSGMQREIRLYKHDGRHSDVARVARSSAFAEERIRKTFASKYNPVEGFVADFQGDPRGSCVKIKVPSGRSDSMDGEGMCVPTPNF